MFVLRVASKKMQHEALFLCRSCVLEHKISEQCVHPADIERALTGTRVIDEVRLAVEKGYKILEIYEV